VNHTTVVSKGNDKVFDLLAWGWGARIEQAAIHRDGWVETDDSLGGAEVNAGMTAGAQRQRVSL
jgi:hypothetical protein